MYEIFVFTASRRKAAEDFDKTIKNSVPDELIVKFLGPSFLKQLRKENPTEPIYAWGATPRRGNIRVWNAMRIGDYVVSYQRGKLTCLLRIIGKVRHENFAKYLWGVGEDPDDLGLTWEYMYFLQKITELDVVSPKLFYGHTDPLRATTRKLIENVIQEATGKTLEDIDAEIKISKLIRRRVKIKKPKRAVGFVFKILDRIDKGDFSAPDTWTRGRIRLGQSILREIVLRMYDYKCCICSFDIPELLEIAHIRGWAEDPFNRLNPENCLVLCPLHHKAYDKGYIKIRNNKIYVTDKTRAFTSEVVRKNLLDYDGKELRKPIHDFHKVINEIKEELSGIRTIQTTNISQPFAV